MKKGALLILALAFAGSGVLAGGAGWESDFERAAKKARKSERPILVEFTKGEASKKLNKEVFWKSKFKSWARKNVVLVELDYGKRLSEKREAQYGELKKKYGIEEFPTVLLVTHDGKVLGRPTLSREGGVEAWIEEATEMVDAASAAGVWLTDFEEAKKLARRTKKPMLLDFNGSDW